MIGVLAALSFFNARDDSTTSTPPGPGVVVPAQGGAAGQRLRAGNVELRYGDIAQRARARSLADELAGAPSPALEATGQAVLIVPERGLHGVRVVAWRHELTAQDAQDPRVRAFVEYWLGRGDGASGR